MDKKGYFAPQVEVMQIEATEVIASSMPLPDIQVG